jgi:hypothetical protein
VCECACACARVCALCSRLGACVWCVRACARAYGVPSPQRVISAAERLRRPLLLLPVIRAARAREQAGWDANRHYEILMTGCARARHPHGAARAKAAPWSGGSGHVVGWQVCAVLDGRPRRAARAHNVTSPHARTNACTHAQTDACTDARMHGRSHRTQMRARTHSTAGHRRPGAAVVSRS